MKFTVIYNDIEYIFQIPNWKTTLNICNQCVEVDQYENIYTNGLKEKRLFIEECLVSHKINNLNFNTIDYLWYTLKQEIFLTNLELNNLIKQSKAYIAEGSVIGVFDPTILEALYLHQGKLNFNLEELNRLTNKQIEKINCILKVFNE